MRVSVVIPTYRPGELLAQAIESALAQGVPDTEIVVVDDASPAESRPLLEELAGRYPIRLIRREQNGGPAAGHNTGIGQAQGEFVAFLEHDDLFLPGKLEKQLAALEAHPDWGACYCGYVEVGLKGEQTGAPETLRREGDAVLPELLARNFISSLSLVVARRACLLEAGGLDETFSVAHDYDLWLRIACSRWRIGPVPERLLGYRRHEESWGARNQARCIEETLRALEKCRAARPDAWRWGAAHYARSWYRLGKLHAREGRPAEASACYCRALDANPRYLKAYARWLLSGAARKGPA